MPPNALLDRSEPAQAGRCQGSLDIFSESNSGANTLITFNASDKLTINGVTSGQLQATDFFL